MTCKWCDIRIRLLLAMVALASITLVVILPTWDFEQGHHNWVLLIKSSRYPQYPGCLIVKTPGDYNLQIIRNHGLLRTKSLSQDLDKSIFSMKRSK